MKTDPQRTDVVVMLNPAFLQALAARSLLSGVREEVAQLENLLQGEAQQTDAADLYRRLCLAQAELETLLEGLPRTCVP